MSADGVDPARFPISEVTQLNVAYTHTTRLRVNAKCMREFAQDAEETRVIPANPKDPKSQDTTLFVGMPLVCWKTKRRRKGRLCALGDLVCCGTGRGEDAIQRKLEEVDREAGKRRRTCQT